jgi:hypothetical protein
MLSKMTEREVLASVKFWRDQGMEWWAHLTLPVLLIFLCGLTNLPRLTAWSAAALGCAVYTWLKGWVPWQAMVYQLSKGRAFDEPPSDIQTVTKNFINEPKKRLRAGAITATAALTPWVAYAINFLFGVKQIGHATQTGLPIWGFLVLGLADGIRASTLAMRSRTGDVLRQWDDLKAASSRSGMTPLEADTKQ